MATLHSFICMLEWLASITCLIYGYRNKQDYPYLWVISFTLLIFFPLLNELILCLKGAICKRRVKDANYSERHNLDECIPIVYSTRYNIHAFGLEKLHPFDSQKYKRIYEDLIESKTINLTKMKVHAPQVPDREFLQ